MIRRFQRLSLERQLFLSFFSLCTVLLLLFTGTTLWLDISRQRQALDSTISNTAAYVASLRPVADMLEQGYPANYQLIVDRVNNSDTLEVQVEMTPEMFSDQLSEVAAREKAIVAALKSMLGIYAKVKLVAPKSIVRSEGKAVRVIDKRKI